MQGIGGAALGSLLIPDLFKSSGSDQLPAGIKHFASKAKRVIYLFQNGAPSQFESFDYKPLLNKMYGEDPARIHTAGSTADNHDFRSGTLSPCWVKI